MTSISGAVEVAFWAIPISQAIATSDSRYNKAPPVLRGTTTKGKQNDQSQRDRIVKEEDLISEVGDDKMFHDSKASKDDALLVYGVYTKAVDPMESIRENMMPHSSSIKKKCKNGKTKKSRQPAVPKKQLKSKTGAPSSPVLTKKTVKSKAGTISFAISKEGVKKEEAPFKGEQPAPAKEIKSNAASKKEKSPPLKFASGDKEKIKANDKQATSAVKGATRRIVVVDRNTEEIDNVDIICNEYEIWEEPQPLHEGKQTLSNNTLNNDDKKINNFTANDDKIVFQISNNTDIEYIMNENANDDDITLVPYNSNHGESYENDTEIRIQSHLTDTYHEQQLMGGGLEFNDGTQDVGSYFNQLSALGFVIIVIAISATIASVFALLRHRHRRNERNVSSSDIQQIEVVDMNMYDMNMRQIRDKYESTLYITNK
jgi:hypothetical protein